MLQLTLVRWSFTAKNNCLTQVVSNTTLPDCYYLSQKDFFQHNGTSLLRIILRNTLQFPELS